MGWGRLGREVQGRRELLGLTAQQCTTGRDISDTTWDKLEKGQPVNGPKLAHVAAALRWTRESPGRILAGGAPLDVSPDALLSSHSDSEFWPMWFEEWLTSQLGEIQATVRLLAQRVEKLEAWRESHGAESAGPHQ